MTPESVQVGLSYEQTKATGRPVAFRRASMNEVDASPMLRLPKYELL